MIDFAAVSNAYFASRYVKPTKRRDGRKSEHRAKAHRHFDLIWRERHMSRSDAYKWLSFAMGKPLDDTHMGMMTKEDCDLVTKLSIAKLRDLRRQPK